MDLEKAVQQVLGIVKAAAPLVGMAEEVEAAENLVKEVGKLVDTFKGVANSDDQAALAAGMETLRAEAKATVNRVTDRL